MRMPAALLLMVASAAATSTEEVDVRCPVCAHEFKAVEWHSTNDAGGVDRDFCRHAAGGSVLPHIAWTCPQCLFTGVQGDFDDETPEDLVARLREKNPLEAAIPVDRASKRTEDIPAWVRFDLWYQVLELREASTEQLAWTRLHTAHTLRLDFQIPESLRERLAAFAKAYEDDSLKEMGAYDRAMAVAKRLEAEEAEPGLRLAAAALYFKRGESPAAVRVLETLSDAADALPDDERAALADLQQRIRREQVYNRRAIPLFAEHAKGVEDAEERAAIRYLIGELHRKLGERAQALEALTALREAKLPEGLRGWVEDAIAKSGSD